MRKNIVIKCLILCLVSIIYGIIVPQYFSNIKAAQEVRFNVTDPNRSNEVGRPQTYDYSPSILEENGETKVYVCGGGQPGDPYEGKDAVYLTVFKNGVKTLDSQRVLSPLLNNEGDDGNHACAPSVIKHSFSQLEGGKEKYLMYYECAPYTNRKSDRAVFSMFTQICVAYSDDGLSWKKYNSDIFSSQFRFANPDEPPTAVITINPIMEAKYKIEKIDNKYWMGLSESEFDIAKGDINAYGVGHPSALVRNGEIWLYYYDSVGNWGDRGTYLAKSNDGFHFYDIKKIPALKSPPSIQYVTGPIAGHPGMFVYLGGAFSVLYYNYSWDGLTWAWNEIDSVDFYKTFLNQNYSLGKVVGDKCTAPGSMGLAANKYGATSSLDVELYSNEGYLGGLDGCTSSNGCTCYSPLEDQSRGHTWQTTMYRGKFSALSSLPGDLNADGSVDIFDYNLLISKFGDPYTIFDYNTLVGNFGK